MKKILVSIICILSFCYKVKAQKETTNDETALEKDIKNFISKKGNFSEFKKDKIGTYNTLTEFSTNVKPAKSSFEYSILENTINGTSAFVYENNSSGDAAIFFIQLSELFLYKNKGFTKSNYLSQNGITAYTISYKGEIIGFYKTEEPEKYKLKILLLIGNLKQEDIRTYIAAKTLANVDVDDFIKPESTSNVKPKVSNNVLNSLDKLTKSVENFEKEKTKSTIAEKPIFDIDKFIKDYDNSTKSTGKEKTNFEKINDLFDKQKNKNDSNKVYINKASDEEIARFLSRAESLAIEDLQNAILKLLEQRKIGFNSLKKEEKSKINDLTYYYAEPNIPLFASSIYISEKNGKNAYCAYYKSSYEKELISKAFFNLPTFNKSSPLLRFDESQVVRKNMIVFDLYISDHKLGSYIIFNDTKESSIQIYEDGY